MNAKIKAIRILCFILEPHMSRRYCTTIGYRLSTFIVLCCICYGALLNADDLPPLFLIQETNSKAEAVILCKIESVHTTKGGFTETTVKIQKVYRGPFRTGNILIFYSIEDYDSYPTNKLDQGRIVFLTSRNNNGVKEWGQASDFFEFTYSMHLETMVMTILNNKKNVF